MELLIPEIEARLLDNGRQQELVCGTGREIGFCPVVKLSTPDGEAHTPFMRARRRRDGCVEYLSVTDENHLFYSAHQCSVDQNAV